MTRPTITGYRMDRIVQFRSTPEDVEAIQKAASVRHTTTSQLIRDLLVESGVLDNDN